MRATLIHPSSEHRRRSPRNPSRGRRDVERVAHAVAARARQAGKRITREPIGASRIGDIIVERTRAVGGPLDLATYSCECGLIFSAAVSTTVCCPHCGAEQDW